MSSFLVICLLNILLCFTNVNGRAKPMVFENAAAPAPCCLPIQFQCTDYEWLAENVSNQAVLGRGVLSIASDGQSQKAFANITWMNAGDPTPIIYGELVDSPNVQITIYSNDHCTFLRYTCIL